MKMVEIAILVLIGFFMLDFLPRNYNEFQRICAQTWPKDANQYRICLEPYSRETNLDKYAIGAGVIASVFIPVAYIFKQQETS